MENSLSPHADLHCLLVEDLIVFAWKACWIDLDLAIVDNQFPTLRLVFLLCATFFVFYIMQRFCRLLDCPTWTNISWWYRSYGRTSWIPVLWLDFVATETCCDVSSSSLSLWTVLLLPLWVNFFTVAIWYTNVTARLIFYFMATCFCWRYNQFFCLCQHYGRTSWPYWLLCWRYDLDYVYVNTY